MAKDGAAQGLSVNEISKLLRRDRATLLRWIGNESAPTCGSRTVGARVEWRMNVAELVVWLEKRARDEERARVEAKLGAELDRLRRALELAAGEGGEPVSRAEALRRSAVAAARLAEIDLAEREGALIARERVERDSLAIEAARHQVLLSLPSKLAPDLAGFNTPGECAKLLDAEIRDCLNRIYDGVHAAREELSNPLEDGGVLEIRVGNVEVLARHVGSEAAGR